METTEELTDADSFSVLYSHADGFRNYLGSKAMIPGMSPEAFLVDKARMLNLTKSEMAALVGGMRVVGCNAGGSQLGVLTDKPGTLSNDFFVTLMDMGIKWETVLAEETKESYEAKDRKTGEVKWKASRFDLVFGSNSELRALSEYYAQAGGNDCLVKDFVAAWAKVMDLGKGEGW